MDLPLLLTLLVGLVVGALIAWLATRTRYAAPLAAVSAERDVLRQRVDELRRDEEGDETVMAALAPVTSALARVERQVGVLERDRVEQFGELGARLAEVGAVTGALRAETATLAGSLNASTVRGAWGEAQLRRILEYAGMLPRCDFDEQVAAVTAHEARVRPDVIVRLTAGRVLVVDAKAPLSAFLKANTDGLEPAKRDALLARHAAALRSHIDTLAAKEYWTAFDHTPEFVVAFVPSDAVLATALAHDPELFDRSLSARVVLASPSTLIALLRTVALVWQQETLTDNARELLTLGRELHTRIATLGGHVSRLGGSLTRSVEAYNAAVGALESRVLVTARRFDTLADIPTVTPIDATPRTLTALELIDDAAESEHAYRTTFLNARPGSHSDHRQGECRPGATG